MIEDIGNILLSGGVKLLGSTVKGTTELGLRKLGDFVKDKTGIDLFDGSIAANGGLNPEQTAALQKLENDYQLQIQNISLEYAKVTQADAASARGMQQTALTSEYASPLARDFIYYFALLWSLFAILYIFGITFFPIPEGNQRVVDTILGFVLGTVIASIIGFFFGNSFRSPLGRSSGVPSVSTPTTGVR